MQIITPGIYRHYKGNTYEVIGIGKHANTHEDLVLYRGLYNSEEFGNNPLWVRPVTEFAESVMVDGIEVERFTRVDE